MQMSSDAYVPDHLLVFHEVFQVGSGVVSLKTLIQIVFFVVNFWHDGSLKSLSIFLFDQNLSLRVHFLMRLVVLFILVQNYSVLVTGVHNFDIRPELWLLLPVLLFRLL